MPQIDYTKLKNEALSNASSSVQKQYGYKPEVETTPVPTGPEKDAPMNEASNFDLLADVNVTKYLGELDDLNKGIDKTYNFSYETTLKNVFNGAYDNAVNSKDKEISNAWTVFKTQTTSYLEGLNKYSKGELTKDEANEIQLLEQELLASWQDAKESLEVYYDEKAGEHKHRSDEGRKLYYSPTADRVVDGLEFEKNESIIYQGSFFSNTPAYIEKHNPSKFNVGMTVVSKGVQQIGGLGWLGKTADYLFGIDPDDLKERTEKTRLAGYEAAQTMLTETDPVTEAAAGSLTQSYFKNAMRMTAVDKRRKTVFKDKESAYVKHLQDLETNLTRLLDLNAEGGDDNAIDLRASFEQATKYAVGGPKDYLKNWLKSNSKDIESITKNMTAVQNVQMYKYFKRNAEWNSDIFSNGYYFHNDKTKGENELINWKNKIEPYIQEQTNLRKDLYKINQKVIGKMRNDLNPDHMQDTSNSFNGDYLDALITKHLIREDGGERTASEVRAYISDDIEKLAEKYPQYKSSPGYEKRYNELMQSEQNNLNQANSSVYTAMVKDRAKELASTDFLSLKKGPEPTQAEKRALDWYYRPKKDGSDMLSGEAWMNQSGEFKEAYNAMSRKFKINFGKQGINEVFKGTMMRDGFGKLGANAIEYKRVDKNNPNAVKTKHFNKVVDIAKKSFKDTKLAGRVYIKDGALEHTDRPDMYTDKNNQEKLDLINDFFKNENTSDYKISYINQTADRNKIAYMISEYDKDDNFKNHITLFMDRDYAKDNEETFAQNVYSDLSDDRYRIQGFYDLSALDDERVGTNLKLEPEDGAMFLTGDKEDGTELKIFMGSNSYTTIDEAIEKVRYNFSEYIKNFKAQ